MSVVNRGRLPVRKELFRSKDFEVIGVCGLGSDTLVITFDSYTDVRRLGRNGFGENFFQARGFDALHFMSRENDWYLYPDLMSAAAIAKDIAVSYRRVLTYGSSMGAYAAIRFGGSVGASEALAFSPQFSLDPDVVPFENRWAADAERINFALEEQSQFVPKALVFYDPYDLDHKHVELIAQHTVVVPIRLPSSGHPAIGYVSELGLLQSTLLEVLDGQFDPLTFERKARKQRKSSGQFYFNLSRRARNPSLKLYLAELAVKWSPYNTHFHCHYGLLLAGQGSFVEAQSAYDKARELAPDNPVPLYGLSEYHELAGDVASALKVIDELIAKNPSTTSFHPRRKYLQALIDKAAETPKSPERSTSGGKSFASDFKQKFKRLTEIAESGSTRFAKLCASLRSTTSGRTIHNHENISATPEWRYLDVMTTTTPSPPPLLSSWKRHSDLMNQLPGKPVDIFLIGDSLAQYWPDELWSPLEVFNFGIAADKTQHSLWRLGQLAPGQIKARHALIVLGTNNLGAGDTPQGIAEGIGAVATEVKRISAGIMVTVLEIPPAGLRFAFRQEDRLSTNRHLHKVESFKSINVDKEITSDFSETRHHYLEDRIHFAAEGYQILTKKLREVLTFGTL